MLYRALRSIVSQLAALVFLAGAVGVALITMAFEDQPPLVTGEWQPSRPWHWPEQPLAPIQIEPWLCITKVEGSPERVC